MKSKGIRNFPRGDCRPTDPPAKKTDLVETVRFFHGELFGLTTFSLSELNLTQKQREKEIIRVSSQLGLTVFPLIESS